MKGEKRSKNTRFSKDRQPKKRKITYPDKSESSWCRRLEKSEFQEVTFDTGNVFSAPLIDGNEGTSKFLRPKPDSMPKQIDQIYTAASAPEINEMENLVGNRGMIIKMLNTSIRNHECNSVDIILKEVVVKGVTERWVVICSNCNFKESFKLYTEVNNDDENDDDDETVAKRGAKEAIPNVGFGVGIIEAAISLDRLVND